MKITDFSPRATPFITKLTGNNLWIAEIGTDVGAHAQAIMENCSVSKLILVDTWENQYMYGYCVSRLHTRGWYHNLIFRHMTSHEAALQLTNIWLDGIYIDITHDYDTVKQSLEDWWPLLKSGGVLGYRNYSASQTGLKQAVDEFTAKHQIRTEADRYSREIILFKD